MKTQKKYRTKFTVRSYEVNTHGKATIPSVCNYFQEAAGLHAKHLKFDISDLLEKGMTWILYKMHIKMNFFPERWQNVDVLTWPSSGDGLRAFRDYELRDESDNLMGYALSQWMILNTETRRPVRLPKEILELGLKTDNHVMEPDKKPIKNLGSEGADFICKVGEYDLDMNNHVNNVKYIDWVTGFNNLNPNMVCNEINIQYQSEAKLNEPVYHKELISENGSKKHTLFKGEDKEPIASAVTHWKEI